jgi:hypothetical protein
VNIMQLHTDNQYEQMYSLSNICVDQNMMDNMFNFLRLRESLAYVYNEKTLPPEVKNLWVQNILIITTALVEALLQSSFERLKILCKSGYCRNIQHLDTSDFMSREISRVPFKQLIDMAEKYGKLNISKKLINELRQLRNNVHISNSKSILSQDQRLVAGYANLAFEVFDTLVLSLHQYFKSFNI